MDAGELTGEGGIDALVSLCGLFFRGAFLTNALPHLINGLSGNAFRSARLSPPELAYFLGDRRNLLWGLFDDLLISYLTIMMFMSYFSFSYIYCIPRWYY